MGIPWQLWMHLQNNDPKSGTAYPTSKCLLHEAACIVGVHVSGGQNVYCADGAGNA